MSEQPYVAPPRFTADGRPITTGGRAGQLGAREDQAEAMRDAAAEVSEYAEMHSGLLAQVEQAREELGIENEPSLLSEATLKEGEALDANTLLNAAMNTAVARSVQGSTERLQAARMTPEQRIGAEVTRAIVAGVNQVEQTEPPEDDFELAAEQSDDDWAAEAVAEINRDHAAAREQAMEEAAVKAEAAEEAFWAEDWEDE